MKLYSLNIEGFRRIAESEILFGDATFLIGENNAGKSTILKAIEYLLSAKRFIPGDEYYSVIDSDTGETKPAVRTITFEAEFRNLPEEAVNWRGFKGRVFSYETDDNADTGLSVIYRKTFEFGKEVVIEFKSKAREVKEKYAKCKTGQDYIDNGIDLDLITELFPDTDRNIGKSKGALEKLNLIDDIWELKDEEKWFQNPGGIPGNVLRMLPRFLVIPADTSISEIEGASSGVLGKTLNELFEEVRESSENYQKAQSFLDELSKELDPQDENSEFGKMIKELNGVLSSVFPDTQLHATTDLSDPDKALKPSFKIEMSSNVKTPINNQGSGMVRAAAFGMLRFRQKWLSKKEDELARSLIVCFEEPEIYLHPSAANQMRDAIYDLSGKESQIIASTHSPFIIDLSRKPGQILNNLNITDTGIQNVPFSVSKAYKTLKEDDKQHVKMLLRIDSHIARMFFTTNVIIIEGDTEEIVILESLKKLPKEEYLKIVSNFEIIKARGKASIIGLVKYLTSMGIEPIVVHDRDKGNEGAEKFNQPIADATQAKGRVIQMHETIEDEIGYYTPSNEKPLRAYKETLSWGDNWNDVPKRWKDKMKEIFGDYIQSE